MRNPPLTTSRRDSGAPKPGAPRRLALSAVVVLTALACATPAVATPMPTAAGSAPTALATGATSQGIIMRDGGICDPIRHMGC